MKAAKFLSLLVATLALLAAAECALAEPYLAVQKGLQCSMCHSNPAGGGKRTAYGNVFAQSELPARRLGDGKFWTGELAKWLSVGGDLRASFEDVDMPQRDSTADTEFGRGTFYVEAFIVPNRLSIYVDEQFSPDGLENRELYLRLNSKNTKWFVAGGEFYLPYGLRLQDDTAFVRQASGINFANTGRGVQGGYVAGPWSAIASVTRGDGDDASDRQVSLVTSHVRSNWRVGVSANVNDDDAGDRAMLGLFAGLKTGPVAWLAEIDRINDDISPGLTIDAIAAFLEANWSLRAGSNLKFSYDYLDPDGDVREDHQVRYSLVWEHSPVQFVQARVGYRLYDGVPQSAPQNRRVFFIELHGFF
ncbi:MAG: hypothetical protein OEW64_05445 [Gammaproteobacteria bacterium]|nr:hypothetical protein [Gammaproteobacteria bacterium]MDH5303524.1 hypothetical protein [Gammaproteobacteria bacterium]MDH5321866.1 hypothetical protein [Gammaproteobacteria bacterium]